MVLATIDVFKAKDISTIYFVPKGTSEAINQLIINDTKNILASIENEKLLTLLKESFSNWEVSKQLKFPELISVFLLQKKIFWKFLIDYINKSDWIISVIIELENYYIKIQEFLIESIHKKNMLDQTRLDEAQRLRSEMEQFAYVASHDLQEPLRTVSSYVQLLARRYKDKLDQDANEFIDFAVDGSNRMRELINSLLEYSRVSRLKPFESINLNEMLDQVAAELMVKEKNAKIVFNNLPEVYGDTVLIGQLFHHLISNALKFRSENEPEVLIDGKKTDGGYLFSIRDNGIGIKKENWERIFIIFQRLNEKNKYPGGGMGLAICKKIIENHGGKIWVESEMGKGTVFYFTLNNYRKEL